MIFMVLLKGRILRFKGRNALGDAKAFEKELQGRCIREGASLEITHETKLSVTRSPFDEIPTPNELAGNGQRDAFATSRL